MRKHELAALAATLGALAASPVCAQVEKDPVARLNQLGRYAGRATVCQHFGFDVHQDKVEAYANKGTAFGVGAGFSETLAFTYIKNAMDQAMQQAQADVGSMSGKDQQDEAGIAKSVLGGARKIIVSCREVARDPAGRDIVSDSPLSDEELVRSTTDKILAPTGYASWQTPYMRAGADMIQAVAVCKAHLTPVQAKAYVAELYAPNRFPTEVADRAQRYFEFWEEKGREDMSGMNLDAAQCTRLLTGRAAALKATPR